MQKEGKLVFSTDNAILPDPKWTWILYGDVAQRVELMAAHWAPFLISQYRKANIQVDSLHGRIGPVYGYQDWMTFLTTTGADRIMTPTAKTIETAYNHGVNRVVVHVGESLHNFESIAQALIAYPTVTVGPENDPNLQIGFHAAVAQARSYHDVFGLGPSRAHATLDWGHLALRAGMTDLPDTAVNYYCDEVYKIINLCPVVVHAALNFGGDQGALNVLELKPATLDRFLQLCQLPGILKVVVENQNKVPFALQNKKEYIAKSRAAAGLLAPINNF